MCRHCGFGLLLALLDELGNLWRGDEEVVPVGVAVLLVEEGSDVLIATSCLDHQLLQLLILLDGLLRYATGTAVVEIFFVGCYDGFLQTLWSLGHKFCAVELVGEGVDVGRVVGQKQVADGIVASSNSLWIGANGEQKISIGTT